MRCGVGVGGAEDYRDLRASRRDSVGACEAFSSGCLYLWLTRDLQGTRVGVGRACAS